MSGEPSLQARRAFTTTPAELNHDTVNPSSGYGGISEKISRLNDILRKLEARRSADTVCNYDGPDVSTPPIWPPTLYNTKAALERPRTTTDTLHGVLDMLPRRHDGALHISHARSTEGALLNSLVGHHHASGGVLDMPTRSCYSLGGGVFDALSRHRHVRRSGMLSQKHYADGHDRLDTPSRYQLVESGDLDVLGTLSRHHTRECGLLGTFMRGHHSRGGGIDTLPMNQADQSGMLHIVSHPHAASTSRVSGLHSEIDSYTPTRHSHLLRASPAQNNHNRHELTHNCCHNSEPFQHDYNSACVDHNFEKQRASSVEFLSHDKECTKSSLNLVEMAHEILARLGRLERQQPTGTRPKLQRTLSKKVDVQKLGGKRKLPRQERGLLHVVRRRAKNGTTNACEEKSLTRAHNNKVEEIMKRVQRLESELELCWSTINQLCIDNDQFREEQQRLTQRIGPPKQWSGTFAHIKSSSNNHTIKGDSKTKKRGGKLALYGDLPMKTNDASGQC